jgi:hypothetical protein
MIEAILATAGGGLANRVQCVESCILLASEVGAPLTILWPIGPHMVTSFHSLFKPPDGVTIVEGTDWNITKNCIDAFGADVKFDQEKFKERLEYFSDLELVNVLSQWRRPQITQCRRFFRGGKRGKFLELRESVADSVKAAEQLATGKIGVHIRRSDHDYARRQSPNFAFYFMLDNLPKDRQIFLCTDDDVVEKEIVERYPARVYLRSKTSRNRSDEIAAVEALIDMTLLSETDSIIGSDGSTFSQCAAYWGNIMLHIARPWG